MFLEGFEAYLGVVAAKIIFGIFTFCSILMLGVGYFYIRAVFVWPYKARQGTTAYKNMKEQVINRTRNPNDLFNLQVYILAHGNPGVALDNALGTFEGYLLGKVYRDGLRECWLIQCSSGKVMYNGEIDD